MVFFRVPEDSIKIDGIEYEVTNSCNQDHFACKEKFLDIVLHIATVYDDDEGLNPDNLGSWKKELISKLKDFEKKYQKHAKQTNPLLADIHKKAMQPVTDLTESAVNLDNFFRL